VHAYGSAGGGHFPVHMPYALVHTQTWQVSFHGNSANQPLLRFTPLSWSSNFPLAIGKLFQLPPQLNCVHTTHPYLIETQRMTISLIAFHVLMHQSIASNLKLLLRDCCTGVDTANRFLFTEMLVN